MHAVRVRYYASRCHHCREPGDTLNGGLDRAIAEAVEAGRMASEDTAETFTFATFPVNGRFIIHMPSWRKDASDVPWRCSAHV